MADQNQVTPTKENNKRELSPSTKLSPYDEYKRRKLSESENEEKKEAEKQEQTISSLSLKTKVSNLPIRVTNRAHFVSPKKPKDNKPPAEGVVYTFLDKKGDFIRGIGWGKPLIHHLEKNLKVNSCYIIQSAILAPSDKKHSWSVVDFEFTLQTDTKFLPCTTMENFPQLPPPCYTEFADIKTPLQNEHLPPIDIVGIYSGSGTFQVGKFEEKTIILTNEEFKSEITIIIGMKQETFLAATKLEETVSIISCRFLTPTSLPPKGTVLQAHYDSILSTNVDEANPRVKAIIDAMPK